MSPEYGWLSRCKTLSPPDLHPAVAMRSVTRRKPIKSAKYPTTATAERHDVRRSPRRRQVDGNGDRAFDAAIGPEGAPDPNTPFDRHRHTGLRRRQRDLCTLGIQTIGGSQTGWQQNHREHKKQTTHELMTQCEIIGSTLPRPPAATKRQT